MARIMISLSDDNSTNKLLSALAVMALSLSDADDNHDLGKLGLKDLFIGAFNDSKQLLQRWGALRAMTVIANRFKQTWVCDEDLAYDLSVVMKEVGVKVKADHTGVTAEQLTMWNRLRVHFNKDSPSSWKYVVSNVKLLRNPKLSAAYLGMLEKVSDVDISGVNTQRMSALTKQLSGRQHDLVMTPIEVSKYNDDYPKQVAEYRALYKLFNNGFKYELKKFVRSSGKDKVKVDEASKYLAKLGLDNTPKGFKGMVDEDAKYYTTSGHMINGSIIGTVVMNPSYDPKHDGTYVCASVATNRNGRRQEWRTLNFTHNKTIERFDAVKEMADKVSSIRKKWAADLKGGDSKVEAMAALIEVAYSTLARVGGVGNQTEDGETTYGLSTLLVQHVRVDAKGAHFDYAGKKGTAQPATLFPRGPTEKRAIAVIKRLMVGKKKTDHLFTYNGRMIGPRDVNNYLRSLGVPTKFTIHKFRHLAGTRMFIDIVKGSPFRKGQPDTTQSAVEKWYKLAMIPLGEALHHRTGEKVTSSTALNSYVDVGFQRDFFKDLGLREPNFLAKKKAR